MLHGQSSWSIFIWPHNTSTERIPSTRSLRDELLRVDSFKFSAHLLKLSGILKIVRLCMDSYDTFYEISQYHKQMRGFLWRDNGRGSGESWQWRRVQKQEWLLEFFFYSQSDPPSPCKKDTRRGFENSVFRCCVQFIFSPEDNINSMYM
jgi:hypothetical protein